ncbi:MAG: hypothetical protein KBC35_01795 [Candidatus Pacebacteria bacterium]|nr:hypothetical protein [Candidatus Paceibacterota bacterium]
MSFWMGITVPKNRARREWRGTPRVPMTARERNALSKRLQRKRAERLRIRSTKTKLFF